MEICPLCGRPIEKPKHANRHHLRPLSRGGKGGDIIRLHRICHQKIHSVFTEKELERAYDTIESLLKSPEIRKFVRWVRKKPSGFYDSNKTMNSLRDKRGDWKRRMK